MPRVDLVRASRMRPVEAGAARACAAHSSHYAVLQGVKAQVLEVRHGDAHNLDMPSRVKLQCDGVSGWTSDTAGQSGDILLARELSEEEAARQREWTAKIGDDCAAIQAHAAFRGGIRLPDGEEKPPPLIGAFACPVPVLAGEAGGSYTFMRTLSDGALRAAERALPPRRRHTRHRLGNAARL